MSNFPTSLDNDSTLPPVIDNITEEAGDAINALRDAVFNIEAEIGIGASGTAGSIAARLGVSLDPVGNIKPSAIASLGLVTLPIFDSQISPVAGIAETKLALAYSTTTLHNLILNNQIDIATILSFIAGPGSEIAPHIAGTGFNHLLSAINVAASSAGFLTNASGAFRNNTNSYTLLSDINTDLNTHETASGTIFGVVPPTNYGHIAGGIFLNTSSFDFIPQTVTDVQSLANFLDSSSLFLLGTRIQTLYSNGVPRSARATSLLDSVHGQLIVPVTSATTYLLHGGSSTPVDDIDHGDDLVEFTPTLGSSFVFDEQFSEARVGDILTVNYGNITVPFVIREIKYIPGVGSRRFVVRVNGKNLLATTTATAQINRPQFNLDKYGVLALAAAHNPDTNLYPSLIVGSPRGAQVIGSTFIADQLDSTHYQLYLQFYPSGNPNDGVVTLPPIDVTGNTGTTPGSYTLDTVIAATNEAFRKEGYNYRFIAFDYFGAFGLMLADHYNNASFSIVAGVVDNTGMYNSSQSNSVYPNNLIDVFTPKDALGLGPNGSGVATPAFNAAPANSQQAQLPTIIWPPLKRKNYYVNGVERDSFNVEPFQLIDGYGDGYWPAAILSETIVPSIRVEVTYRVLFNLSNSGLKIGNTIVVQKELGQGGSVVDFGRFIIKDVQFNNCNCDGYTGYTDITVFDAIHSTGTSPFANAAVGTKLRLYYNGNSVGFNLENSTDVTSVTGFKRHIEVYIDQNGHTFTQERGRLSATGSNLTVNTIPLYSSSGNISAINISKISPKLRGYPFGSVNKINLQITSFDQVSGTFTGFLCRFDGITPTNQGPTIVGKQGLITRFYDNTLVNYIDFFFDPTSSISSFSNQNIDVQLFQTLSLDDEVMLLGTCQVNDLNKTVKYIKDERQFGNTSENDLSSSALDFISAPTKMLRENGIIRGFDVTSISGNNVFVNGGSAVINGKIVQVNNSVAAIPLVYESVSTVPGVPPTPPNTVNNQTIVWFLCVNDGGDLETIASTDFDPNGAFISNYTAAGVDNTRLFYATNPVPSPGTPYVIRGDYFSDLVINQRDVVPIAVITSTVSVVSQVASTVATSTDARRFVYNGYNGLNYPLTLGNNASFQSLASLKTWLTQLNNLVSGTNVTANGVSNKVIVKGHMALSQSTVLDFANPVVFEGDGGAFDVSVANAFVLNNNISLNNLTFNCSFDPVLSGDVNYTDGLLANTANGCLFTNVNASTGNKNITINNCLFKSANGNSAILTNTQKRYPFITFNLLADACVAENISITNNRFQTTNTAEDKTAVIAFVGPGVSPTSINGPRLINCVIDGNKCNKNQLIMISSSVHSFGGSSVILDAISAVNCKVSRNTCGAINVTVKKDTPHTPYNASFSLDKSNGLVVSDNNCHFIYTGYSDGTIARPFGSPPATTFAPLTMNSGLFSGSLMIFNNTASWIHAGFRVPTGYSTQSPVLSIKDNRLSAFDSTFLNDYYTNSGGSAPNTAIIANKLVGS